MTFLIALLALQVGQPIPFSHRQHVETAKLKCADCHKLAPSGEVYSIPQAKLCATCHTNMPELKTGEPIPWVRVYEIPSFVEFSHKTHLSAACSTCHGDIASQDRVTRVVDLNMGTCMSCHVQHKAPTTCHTCHDLDE